MLLIADEEHDAPSPEEPQLLEGLLSTGKEFLGKVEAYLAQLTLNALSGMRTPETFRVTGHISGLLIHILVDGGSTHNFVQAGIWTLSASSAAQHLYARSCWGTVNS